MADSHTLDVRIRKLPSGNPMVVNLHTTVTRELRVRLWLATRLLLLAGWVLGCGFEVEK